MSLIFIGALLSSALGACDGHDVTLGSEGSKGAGDTGGSSGGATTKPPSDDGGPKTTPPPPDDAGACFVQASAYDHSCQVDSDCLAVPLGGNVCDPCSDKGSGDFECPITAVSSAQYSADLAAALQKYQGTSVWNECIVAACPAGLAPSCSGGVCVMKSAVVDSGPSPSTPVTFQLQAAPDAGAFMYGTTQDTDSPNDNWLTLFSSDGATQFDMSLTEPDSGLDCATCGPSEGVPVGLFWGQLGAGGVSTQWDGTVYTRSTCGASQACALHAALPPGSYQAKFCACPPGQFQEGSCNTPSCVSVPFTYPGATVVTGTLP